MNSTILVAIGLISIGASYAFLRYLRRAMQQPTRPAWLKSTAAGDFATVGVVMLFVLGIGLIGGTALR
jgi:hypothetical protein